MGTRTDEVAQLERRRQVAAERRRLLTFALHSAPANDDFFDNAVTDRFQRIALDDIDDDADAEPLPPPPSPTSLGERVEHLRVQAAACRAQAIALNAKLVLFEAERARLRHDTGQVQAVREQLIESSARLDHAIEEIGAVASVERQLADSLR